MKASRTTPSPTGIEPPNYRFWSLAVVAMIVIALASPSLLIDKEPFNYDETVFLATGTYFSSAFEELGGFLKSPAGWSKEYYNQYPAISLRRHPPLFFALEGGFFALFGTNYVVARLSLLVFTVAWSLGFFLLAHRYFKDSALAITATLILLAVTSRIGAIQEVWLDVPTMAWAIWGLYFWDLWRTESRITDGVFFALCCLCALYTYQLSLFLIVAMFAVAGLLWVWPKADFSNSSAREPFVGYFRVVSGFFVLLLPLLIFTLMLGQDQLKVATGGQVEEFARFKKTDSSFSLSGLAFYMKMIAQVFPWALVGTSYFLVSRIFGLRKLQGLDTVLLIATVMTYAGFTVVSSGGTRYAWYIVIPTVFWVADFFGWLTGRIAPKSWQAILCIAISGLVLIESGTRDYSKRFITEPVDMQSAFELLKEKKNLLYSGTFDARFVFTVRSQDPGRKFRIFRGTVQLNEKDDLAVFLEKNNIDAVLVQRSQEGKVVAVHQRMEHKLTDQLPELGFSKIQTLHGREIGESEVPMLDVYTKPK